MPHACVEGLLGSPGLPAVVGVRHPNRVERLGHRHVAAGRVLGQVRRDPADDDSSGMGFPLGHDAHPCRHRVAQRIALRHQRAGDGAGGHGRPGEHFLGRPECRAAVA